MLSKVKELWSKWKLHIAVVGGVIVIGSVWGECKYTPDLSNLIGGETSDVESNVESEPATNSDVTTATSVDEAAKISDVSATVTTDTTASDTTTETE